MHFNSNVVPMRTTAVTAAHSQPQGGIEPRGMSQNVISSLIVTSQIAFVANHALILIGVLLHRYVPFGRDFWPGLEKLVYFVLFPSLLFTSTAQARFDFGATALFLTVGVSATLLGVLLGTAARWVYPDHRSDFASGVQTAFRFNSYLALAIAQRLGAAEAIALMAILVALNVPFSNVAAVYGLARNGGIDLFAAMLRNPLIVATIAGLACNVSGISLPEFATATLGRLGAASLSLGLMTVGAGLRLSGAKAPRPLMVWWLAVKLIALPAFALMAAHSLHLNDIERLTVVMFAALPTAASAYILATRMGGNGPLVAYLISAGTMLSVVTLPVWLLLAR